MNARRLPLFTGTLLFGSCLMTRAFAQEPTVATEVVPTLAGTAIVSRITENPSGWQWRWTADTGRRDITQTFTPLRNATMDKIAFAVRSGSTAAVSKAPFKLTLGRFSDAQATLPTGILNTWSGTLPVNETGMLYQPGTWLVFDIPNVPLSAGNVYGVTLQFQSAGPVGQGVVLSTAQNRAYAGGHSLFSADGQNWTPSGDINFQVLEATVTPPVAGRELVVDRNGGAGFKTITAAAQAARAGDTIRVKPNSGPYREMLLIRASGTPEAPITFDGGGNLLTGFEPLTSWTTEGNDSVCRLPIAFPVVLTYRGERLVEDPVTKQFTKYARLNEARDTLILLPGTSTDGWEISTRMAVVQILDTSNHVYRNVRASGSRNDGFNLHGTGNNLVFENIEGFHNLDEGFSSHDDIQSEVRGGKFWGNDNGVGNVARSSTKFFQVDIWNNLGFGLWLHTCKGEVSGLRSWGNGADQISFRSSTVSVNNVQAFTPASPTRPWLSYMESRPAPVSRAYNTYESQVTGTVTVQPEAAPANVGG